MQSHTLRIDFISELFENLQMTFEVTRLAHPKAVLGGYRDLIRNMVYSNAFSQTDQPQQTRPLCFERDTQIFDLETKSANPLREFGSQTPSAELFVDGRTDKPMQPMKYFDSELWLRRRVEATLFIQKIIRGFLARRRMSNIKRISTQITQERHCLTENRRRVNEAAKMQEIDKRAHPKVG